MNAFRRALVLAILAFGWGSASASGAIKDYGVLKGKVLEGLYSSDSHYQIHVLSGDTHFRVAVNLRSQNTPSELLYFDDSDFRHPITQIVARLANGFTPLRSAPSTGALDYLRDGLIDLSQLRRSSTGSNGNLRDVVEVYVQRAITSPDVTLYAFGARWGPEPSRPDTFFHFEPSNGVHDVHLNQGLPGRFSKEDSPWQDGGLLFHFPKFQGPQGIWPEHWVAIFIVFPTRVSESTEDTSGNTQSINKDRPDSPPAQPDGSWRIEILGTLAGLTLLCTILLLVRRWRANSSPVSGSNELRSNGAKSVPSPPEGLSAPLAASHLVSGGDSFHVFLSYNSEDLPTVRQLALALKGKGIRVWLDRWELIPGRPWQEAIEKVIDRIESAAVLVGAAGIGPWQNREMRIYLDEFVRRGLPLIPVLLPGVPSVPELPPFLRSFTWVDLRSGLSGSALDLLIWGITGKKPASLENEQSPEG